MLKLFGYNSYIIFRMMSVRYRLNQMTVVLWYRVVVGNSTDDMYANLDAELKNGGIEEYAAFLCALPLMYTNDQGSICRLIRILSR